MSEKPKQYGCGTLIVIAVIGYVFVHALSSSNEPAPTSDSFRQVGYFKDDKKNRIFTIAFRVGMGEQQIKRYAEDLVYTEGQMMAAYFYPDGSVIPADGVTLAGSVFKVNDVLYDAEGLSKWQYVYMRSPRGATEFVDCKKTPENSLCRK